MTETTNPKRFEHLNLDISICLDASFPPEADQPQAEDISI
jgi:hypothetical protein